MHFSYLPLLRKMNEKDKKERFAFVGECVIIAIYN